MLCVKRIRVSQFLSFRKVCYRMCTPHPANLLRHVDFMQRSEGHDKRIRTNH
nr:MAG TPA: hypothetical protein [Caudoviricetes sp.]